MPTTKSVELKQLKLDLRNYRTVPQRSEASSINTIIAINPDWFWALMESLLADGYLPTENIIVLKEAGELIVREGNRRVGALKIIHGLVSRSKFDLPAHIKASIDALGPTWFNDNEKIPCAIYDSSEESTVDRIVTLTHGKGEKAGRDKWNAVAKARHNREKAGASEPALDLLERSFKHAKNLTASQRERWSGEYPLSILDEALKRIAARLGASSAKELADSYPHKTSHARALESIVADVGIGVLDFERIRNKQSDFAAAYGVPAPKASTPTTPAASAATSAAKKPATAAATPANPPSTSTAARVAAVPLNDPRSVMRTLKAFRPVGPNRDKVATLVEEARRLKLNRNPLAFCFLLRSMFEISAKAYCDDHKASGGPKYQNASGEDRKLFEVLRDITTHLTRNNTDRQMQKKLHGAIAEMAASSGFLSVTSMNQLVHNPRFTVNESHIAEVFSNIFPLLEQMNQ